MINLAIIGQVFSFLVQSVVCTEKFHKEVIQRYQLMSRDNYWISVQFLGSIICLYRKVS